LVPQRPTVTSQPERSDTRVFRIFAVGSAMLACGLAILGSWVRINEAGMTCPDWPLCKGALVPDLAGGVVFEWTHRLIALTVGFAIVGAAVTGWRVRRRIAGVVPVLGAIFAAFVVQVGVGGITIFQANSPPSVALHWGAAMLLLIGLTTLAVLSIVEPAPGFGVPAVRAGTAFVPLAVAAGFAFVTMCIGAYVSSSHAGLACSTFPACDGSLSGRTTPQELQMAHRFAALAFFAAGAFGTWSAVKSGMERVRAAALTAFCLLLLQISLGVANVLLGMPMLLREAHAANAVATFLAFIVAAVLTTIDPIPLRSLRLDAGRPLRQPV
jgi:cytochrome c oxidase assembly protein subunit 15